MFRRQHVLVSFSVAFATSVVAAGCSDDPQATPRVVLDSTVVPGANPAQGCPEKGTWLTVGSFGTPAAGRTDPTNPDSPFIDPVRPVDDGGSDQQGKVSLTCSVVANGDDFDVKASVELTGATGGAMTFVGTMKRAGESPGLSLSLSREGRTYTSSDCVANYDTSIGQGIADGRVWATIDCAKADAESLSRVCATHAEFRFENCGQ